MLSTKYLDLDSLYRNRNLNPNPAEFTVKVSQYGVKTQLQATDPLTDAYPENIFSPADFYEAPYSSPPTSLSFSTYQEEPLHAPMPYFYGTNSSTVYILKCIIPLLLGGPRFIPGSGYYNGAVLVSKNLNPDPANRPNGLRRITDSILLDTTVANAGQITCFYKITIESPFSGELVIVSSNDAVDNFYIPNPSDIKTDLTQSYMFLPGTVSVSDFYCSPKYILWNQNQSNFAEIVSFDGITHIAQLSDITNLGWEYNHVYVLRRGPPMPFSGSYVFSNNPNLLNASNALTFNLSPTTVVDESFINSFIRIFSNNQNSYTSPTPTQYLEEINVMRITSINNGVQSIALTSGGNGYIVAPTVLIIDSANNFVGSGATANVVLDASGTITNVVISNPGSNYNTNFPPVASLVGGILGPGGTAGVLGACTVFNTVSVDKLNIQTYQPGTLNYFYEILQFSKDNTSQFTFSGSMAAQNKAISQEVSLNHLTLPNTILQNGSRIAFYPYVYIVLQNVSSSSTDNRFILYSNNPNTYQAIFKVPITDMNTPLISPFVRLVGNGMTQTIKFHQNQDMRISILLPNGELFKTF